MRALKGALDIWDEVDMAAVRKKSIALTDLFIQLVEARCGAYGLELESPRDGNARQPGVVPAPAWLPGDASLDRARRDRRFPRAVDHPLRLHAALCRLQGRLAGGRGAGGSCAPARGRKRVSPSRRR